MSKNADYWRGRAKILEDAAHRSAGQTVQAYEQMYRQAEHSVTAEIEKWYGRFAVNNNVSLSEARKMLTTGQLEEFKWTAEQYIQAAQKADLSPEWIRKLENASARFHVSRLEAVQLGIQQQIELLYGNQTDSLDQLLRNVVGNGYTHAAYEIQRGLGLGWDITALNQTKLETLLSKPWTTDGRTFRDRCWLQKAELVDSVNKNLVQGMLRGDAPGKIIDRIKDRFGVQRSKAARLVYTETTYFNATANLQAYKELEVDLVEIIETLDSYTCDICADMDGQTVPLSAYEPGVTVPPFHPNCRGTTAPYIGDIAGERAARTEEGEVYNVPADMSYKDWKAAFVDGGTKDGVTPVVSVKDLEGQLTGKEAELKALEDERRRLSDEWRDARSGVIEYDYGAGEHSQFIQMTDDEYRVYKQGLEDRRDEITRRMEEIVQQRDRPGISDAEYERLCDEARALRKERRELRYQLDTQLPAFEDWRDKYGIKGRDYFETRSKDLEQATKAAEDKIKKKQAEIDELKQKIVEAKAFEAEHAFDLKSVEEMREEILDRHRQIIRQGSHQTELEGIVGGFDKEHANLYNKMSENFTGSSYYQRNAGWYSPADLHVHMDLDSHSWENSMGRTATAAWKTKFHEEFHQLDHILGTQGFGGAAPRSWAFTSTNTPMGQRMIAAIDRDVLRCINQSVDWYNQTYGTAIKQVATLDRISGDAKKTFIKWLREQAPTAKDRAAICPFTDAVGLTTRSKINPYSEGFWGHKGSYQKDRGKNGATSEVWAELGSYLFRGDQEALDILTPFMPDTISEYSSILGEVMEYAKTHTLDYFR